VLMVIFALHRYGRSLGLDAIIAARTVRTATNGRGPPARLLDVLT